MKASSSRTITIGMTLLICTFLFSYRAFPQTTDSLTCRPSGSLQFQLFGGFGVNYIGELDPVSFFRVGVDGSWNHSDNSGDGDGYSIYTWSPGSSSSSTTSQPEQKLTNYGISLSGLYAREIVCYANSALYCGAGPMLSYSHSKYSSKSSSQRIDGSGTYVDTYENSNANKTWGIGPFAILGVKSRLLEHINLSAEMSLSALYQWNSSTYASHSVSSYPPPSSSTISENGNNAHLKGWAFTLSNIRIGIIIGL